MKIILLRGFNHYVKSYARTIVLLALFVTLPSIASAKNGTHVTFDLEPSALDRDVTLSFDYATPVMRQPGSVIYIVHENGFEVRLFNADVVGEQLSIINAFVQYGFQSPLAYRVDDSCKNIELLATNKKIYLTFNISISRKVIYCSTKAQKSRK